MIVDSRKYTIRNWGHNVFVLEMSFLKLVCWMVGNVVKSYGKIKSIPLVQRKTFNANIFNYVTRQEQGLH